MRSQGYHKRTESLILAGSYNQCFFLMIIDTAVYCFFPARLGHNLLGWLNIPRDHLNSLTFVGCS